MKYQNLINKDINKNSPSVPLSLSIEFEFEFPEEGSERLRSEAVLAS
jgi:hypothetical protein